MSALKLSHLDPSTTVGAAGAALGLSRIGKKSYFYQAAGSYESAVPQFVLVFDRLTLDP